MTISDASSLSQAQTLTAISTAVAVKVRNVQKQQGQAVLALLESSVNASPTLNRQATDKSTSLDIYA